MATSPDENPYSAPTVADTIETPPSGRRWGPTPVLQAAWALAVLLNLPVPMMLSESALSDPRAFVGVPFGIAVVYLTGVFCCLCRAGIMWRLVVGSGVTALSQFIPLAHMMIGMLAMGISEAIFDPSRNSRDISSLPEAAFATILTGLGLIAPSLLMGAGIFAIFRISCFDASSDKHPIQARSASE